MLNCREATRLYSESQERALTVKERLLLRMHIAMCSGCRNFGEHMKFLREAMRAYAKGRDNTGEK